MNRLHGRHTQNIFFNHFFGSPSKSQRHRKPRRQSCGTVGRVFETTASQFALEADSGLFLVNHQSFLDPLFVAVFLGRPVSYLARDSLFRVPVIGWILRNTHVIPISREAARGGSIRVALERLESGFLVGIFPEGTRTSDGKVGDFRPGFLALARRTQQPIYPVGIVGAERIMPRNSNWIRPGRVDVVIGAPFTPDELRQLHDSEDDKALCLLARNKVEICTQQSSLIVKNVTSE
jgi:1-acyl-sn-glycerol-3-phosphate acyltransferase